MEDFVGLVLDAVRQKHIMPSAIRKGRSIDHADAREGLYGNKIGERFFFDLAVPATVSGKWVRIVKRFVSQPLGGCLGRRAIPH